MSYYDVLLSRRPDSSTLLMLYETITHRIGMAFGTLLISYHLVAQVVVPLSEGAIPC